MRKKREICLLDGGGRNPRNSKGDVTKEPVEDVEMEEPTDDEAEMEKEAPKINYINGSGPPTKEELEFLSKYAVANTTEKFIKRSRLYVELEPLVYRFQNYEDLTEDLGVLHSHCAKIFDIIIRKTVYAAGGNMNSEFWFG